VPQHPFEAIRQLVCGLRRDRDAIVFEIRLGIARREEFEWSPALRQVLQRERVFGRVEIGVEIVNGELVEVAKHDVARSVRNESRPVVESLPVMSLEILTALLHFDEYNGFPNVVGKGRATAVFIGFADAEFRFAAYIQGARLAESLKQ